MSQQLRFGAVVRRRAGRVRVGLTAMVLTILMSVALPPSTAVGTEVLRVVPSTARPGQRVTIIGEGLRKVTAVTINGFPVQFRVVSPTRILTRAPSVAGRGIVSVSTLLRGLTAPEPFVVRPRVSMTPSLARPSATVRVAGRGFVPAEVVDFLIDGAGVASAVASPAGRMAGSFVIPASMRPGRHVVTAQGRSSGIPVTNRLTVTTPWPQFNLDAGGGRYNRNETSINPGTVESLVLTLANEMGGPVTSSPALVTGQVYVGTLAGALVRMPAGCSGSSLECPTVTVGRTTRPISSSPAVSAGVAYIGSEDGTLFAFDTRCRTRRSGCQALWRGVTDGPIVAAPAVAGRNVYVGSTDGSLYAFAIGCRKGGGTCTPRWTAQTEGPISGVPAVDGSVVYVGSQDGYLYAYDTGCGTGGDACTPIWRGQTGGEIEGGPAVADGVVYVGSSDGGLYAFGVGCATGGETCEPLWKAQTEGPIRSSPAIALGTIVVGSDDGKVYAFSITCGAQPAPCPPTWVAVTGGPVRTAPAIAGDLVYAGSYDGLVYALPFRCQPECRPSWVGTTRAPVRSSPVVADGMVVAGSSDGTLRVWSLP
jgi:outer membrane protein assembly factor BamB